MTTKTFICKTDEEEREDYFADQKMCAALLDAAAESETTRKRIDRFWRYRGELDEVNELRRRRAKAGL